jgi:rhodanese-related sulfurtransferase
MGAQVTVPVARGVEVNARPEAHLLIDVRTPGEFREGHIPGSVNMPLGDMGRFAPALKTRAAGRKVVLVCRTGRGATAAFEQLSREELTDYQVLDGGMMAWAEAGLPVTYGSNGISVEGSSISHSRRGLRKGGQMTDHKPFIAAVTILSLLLASTVFAQHGMKWRGSGGWGPHGQYGRIYDPKTVETFSGQVVQVDRITPMKGMGQGIHMTVKTDQGTMSVHLGPAWYIENQDVKLEPKDTVEVRGSKVTFGGRPVIIAAEVKKGDSVLKLRDDTGMPVWSGWSRRGSP